MQEQGEDVWKREHEKRKKIESYGDEKRDIEGAHMKEMF